MKLEEIENQLPNGFHDARLRTVNVDFAAERAVLELSVWIGELDASQEQAREAYREARLELCGLRLFVIQPPRASSDLTTTGALSVDAGPGLPSREVIELPTMPPACFMHWFYINDWGSFIYICAESARLDWLDESATERG